ncbi:hypothetical protein DSUL_170038 [Desulfovibrionales bacterium]
MSYFLAAPKANIGLNILVLVGRIHDRLIIDDVLVDGQLPGLSRKKNELDLYLDLLFLNGEHFLLLLAESVLT